MIKWKKVYRPVDPVYGVRNYVLEPSRLIGVGFSAYKVGAGT
jgi:hypothetical protein